MTTRETFHYLQKHLGVVGVCLEALGVEEVVDVRSIGGQRCWWKVIRKNRNVCDIIRTIGVRVPSMLFRYVDVCCVNDVGKSCTSIILAYS